MPARRDLGGQARHFAADVTELLNGTICEGLSLSAVVHEPDIAWIALGITKRQPLPRPIPVCLGRKKARFFLRVAYILELDDEARFLTVSKSEYGLYVDRALEQMVLHYDYARNPGNEYPAAHFQLAGSSPGLQAIAKSAGVDKELKDFHFPVGGKRFRPTLEDLVEFLIVEGLVDAHPQWARVVNKHRARWQKLQLSAAVRRDPEVARDALKSLS